jgi:hypothetical protein
LGCRALIGDDTAEVSFAEALTLREATGPFERARTQLCFGEHLRRRGIWREARMHSRAALEASEALGPTPSPRARTPSYAPRA